MGNWSISHSCFFYYSYAEKPCPDLKYHLHSSSDGFRLGSLSNRYESNYTHIVNTTPPKPINQHRQAYPIPNVGKKLRPTPGDDHTKSPRGFSYYACCCLLPPLVSRSTIAHHTFTYHYLDHAFDPIFNSHIYQPEHFTPVPFPSLHQRTPPHGQNPRIPLSTLHARPSVSLPPTPPISTKKPAKEQKARIVLPHPPSSHLRKSATLQYHGDASCLGSSLVAMQGSRH